MDRRVDFLSGGLLVESHEHEFTVNPSGATVTCTFVYADGKPCMTAQSVAIGMSFAPRGARVYHEAEVRDRKPADHDAGAVGYTGRPYSGGSSVEPTPTEWVIEEAAKDCDGAHGPFRTSPNPDTEKIAALAEELGTAILQMGEAQAAFYKGHEPRDEQGAQAVRKIPAPYCAECEKKMGWTRVIRGFLYCRACEWRWSRAAAR